MITGYSGIKMLESGISKSLALFRGSGQGILWRAGTTFFTRELSHRILLDIYDQVGISSFPKVSLH